MSHRGGPVDHEQLRELLSAERLGSYLAASRGEVDGAFELYEWNIDVAGAALSLTAMIEVLVRNALDRQMRAWGSSRGHEDWFDAAPLDRQGRDDLVKARARAARGRTLVTHGHVVAELNFGFWRFLMSRRYLTSLWVPALRHAFPHAPGDARTAQRTLEGHAQQLVYLRNRAAHHEPLHRRDLRRDLERSLMLAGAIHPTAHDWIIQKQEITRVLSRRPGKL